MKISGINSATSSNNTSKKKAISGGGNFADYMNVSENEETSASESASSITSVNPLFMLQEINEDGRSKKKMISHGFDILAYLDKVRVDLLSGNMDIENLKNLESSIKNWRNKFDDPMLEEILNEIELRAVVELAKLQH